MFFCFFFLFLSWKTSVGLSAADQQAILDKHNDLRRKIANGQESRGNPGPQPAASNMRQMKWDNDLAKAAQTLTDRCVYAHDTKIPAGILIHQLNYRTFNEIIILHFVLIV